MFILLFLWMFLFSLVPSTHAQTALSELETSASGAAQIASPAAQPVSYQLPEPDSKIDLTVSPISLTLTTDPGKVVESSITVRNNGTQTEYLQVDLAKFDVDRTGKPRYITEFSSGDIERNWITFEAPSFSVEPGEWHTAHFTFRPPLDAALTYNYALIIKRQKESSADSETLVVAAPAVLLLTTVNSPLVHQELELLEFKTQKKVYEFLPADFTVLVNNVGNVHLAPFGNVFIDGMGENDLALLEVNPDSGLVLPNTQREYTLSWEDGLPVYQEVIEDNQVVLDEKGQPVKKLQWDNKLSKFRIGKYTAHLLLIYDDGERDVPLEAKVSFWVIPWRFLLILTGVAAIIIWKLADMIRLLPRIKIERRNE